MIEEKKYKKNNAIKSFFEIKKQTFNDKNNILKKAISLFKLLDLLDNDLKIDIINEIKKELHQQSPFKMEPVDCVLWVKSNLIKANDYNPNIVAPAEMKLLTHSIEQDGYTQPIVSWENNDVEKYEVIDGFHRSRVGKENKQINERVGDYLPITIVNFKRIKKNDRMASTIRHNRARGKHVIDGMSEIVIELKNRNWTNERISRELGMDEDEILRLCQITGLAGLFSNQDFSKSWDIDDIEPNFIPLTEEFDIEKTDNFRTVNTNDKNRIFHTYNKWECYKAGLYSTNFPGMKKNECEKKYAEFLSDNKRFSKELKYIISKWKYSCEHYLTNSSMNRIAWLGQAAMCYGTGIPAIYKSGFNLLTKKQQEAANKTALKFLNKWLIANNRDEVNMEVALSGKQMELY